MPVTSPPPFSPDELRRYARHLVMPPVGLEGQARLKAGRVLVVGVGGLGSPAALYLAAAGVGTIGVVDADEVEVSNLQRQVLHGTAAVGTPKLESAAARLRDLNPLVDIVCHEGPLTSANARAVIGGYDVVLDGTDNFPARYLVNDACGLLGKPDVYGAVHRFEGQVTVFWAGRGPCYRCLYREPPPPGAVPSCAEAGVLGVVPGVIGTMQASEALKVLLGIGEPLVGRLLLFDALGMRVREVAVERDPACPLCGDGDRMTELIDYEEYCGMKLFGFGRDETLEIEAADVDAARTSGTKPVLVDVRERHEWDICRIEGSILMPLGTLQARWKELPADADVVTVCHTGSRSYMAAKFLRQAGITKVKSMRGGVEAWARTVDPRMPRY